MRDVVKFVGFIVMSVGCMSWSAAAATAAESASTVAVEGAPTATTDAPAATTTLAKTELAIPLPPPLLAPIPVPRVGSGPALSADEAVGAMRNALRRKQYGMAESLLATLPSDAPGYRDLVVKLTELRQEQAATYDALAEAWRNRRCGDLAQITLSSPAFSDLVEVNRQVSTYLEIVDRAYAPTLRRIDDAIIAKDKTIAQAFLNQIPSDERLLPPATLAKRRNALAALAKLEP